MSFKIGVFKILQYPQEFLQKKKIHRKTPVLILYRPSFTEHLWWVILDFRGNNNFFSAELAFIADSRTGFSPNFFENTS